jgi:hypothetical protein
MRENPLDVCKRENWKDTNNMTDYHNDINKLEGNSYDINKSENQGCK